MSTCQGIRKGCENEPSWRRTCGNRVVKGTEFCRQHTPGYKTPLKKAQEENVNLTGDIQKWAVHIEKMRLDILSLKSQLNEQCKWKDEAREENEKLEDELRVGNRLLATATDKQRDLEVENAKLKKFARTFIEVECWGYDPDIDGEEVQEWAERCGLIESYPATEQDVKDFAEYEIEVGDKVFKFTDILKEKK